MTDKEKALACLKCLPCSPLSYNEWLQVGMALQHSGCSVSDWDGWSRTDPKRYQDGLCAQKWKSFRGHNPPVTLGTLIELCRKYGTVPDGLWDFDAKHNDPPINFGFDDVLPHAKRSLAPEWVQPEEIPMPAKDWQPMDFARYLDVMFQPEERVGLCVEAWKPDGKEDARWLPKKGVYDRTAGQLIEMIHACKGDLGSVIGDTHPEAGAWIRINPLDGSGVRDENVTVLRHALLEADDGEIGQQLALIREMKIPVSAIVHSGGKSIHALVKVDAPDMQEYRRRVDYLYKVAEKYGLKTDTSNRNPSRLSRMPGVSRNGKPQYLISGAAGLPDWKAWVDYVEDLKDDLPDPEAVDIKNTPQLPEPIIEGTLRRGRKMMYTGPSKAGKTWVLLNLAAAIANGGKWLGLQVEQGKVLFLNNELPKDTCLNRIRDIWVANGYPEDTQANLRVWHLKGYSTPLDKLAPKLIRRSEKEGYALIIIDPIYKVTTGDENDMEAMAHFCNQLDKIAIKLDCAVVYSHHHSKGAQGHKRALDRASGSGVLARDADALIDMIELDIDATRRGQLIDKMVASELDAYIDTISNGTNAVDDVDRGKSLDYLPAAQLAYPKHANVLREIVTNVHAKAKNMTGWRIERTLREFPYPDPHLVWADHPTHVHDTWELLADAKAAGEEPPWMARQRATEQRRKEERKVKSEALDKGIEACGGLGEATVGAVGEWFYDNGHSNSKNDPHKTVINRLEKRPDLRLIGSGKSAIIAQSKKGRND